MGATAKAQHIVLFALSRGSPDSKSGALGRTRKPREEFNVKKITEKSQITKLKREIKMLDKALGETLAREEELRANDRTLDVVLKGLCFLKPVEKKIPQWKIYALLFVGSVGGVMVKDLISLVL